MCDHSAEGAGEVPGPALPERSHEGQDEEAAGHGSQGGTETPETQESQVCHHLAQL